jgi:hypothetical protein
MGKKRHPKAKRLMITADGGGSVGAGRNDLDQNVTNAIERGRKRSKINETGRCSAAHNGLVADQSRSESTTKSIVFRLRT